MPKIVGHMLSLEHHAPTVSLGEAPQAHLSTSGALNGVHDLENRSALLWWALQGLICCALLWWALQGLIC